MPNQLQAGDQCKYLSPQTTQREMRKKRKEEKLRQKRRVTWHRATMSNRSARISTSFPFPSSPHWEPSTAATWLSDPTRSWTSPPRATSAAAAAAAAATRGRHGSLAKPTPPGLGHERRNLGAPSRAPWGHLLGPWERKGKEEEESRRIAEERLMASGFGGGGLHGSVVSCNQRANEQDAENEGGVGDLVGVIEDSQNDRAHLLFDVHQAVDGLRESELANSLIGTTKRGIGPCYSSKVIRNGLRVCDLRHMDTFGEKLDILLRDAASRFQGFEYSAKMLKEEIERYEKFAERLEPFIADTVHVIHESIAQKRKILVEGGQATMLDIDFGTYPFVTSSNPSAGGICTGLGIAPRLLGDLIGVVKAYTTRVGSDPFPTEILGKGGDLLRTAGMEFGTTTGRPRRCGWLDIINGFSSLNLTKLDVLSGLPELKLGVSYSFDGGKKVESFPADLHESDISSIRNYDDLPEAARHYVESIKELVGVPIHYIGVGPGRDALIFK
ncbi:Adenylosuccinate synthetase, chloroplastic [Ananas comosus]|uniref:Adenylosuccinate synthetase, chloroplastic n=1 Tax=Ananas comosus TaxID=4615 RepID=A0A199VXI4_ANACO|nr:Adenylosuccinate synthetase, chloroplastic [Ananas comosus]